MVAGRLSDRELHKYQETKVYTSTIGKVRMNGTTTASFILAKKISGLDTGQQEYSTL